MNVIVTLGNPFDVYTNTRHNVAATYFDYVAKKYSAKVSETISNDSTYVDIIDQLISFTKKHYALDDSENFNVGKSIPIYRSFIFNSTMFMRPMLGMNSSGIAFEHLINNNTIDKMTVLCDDIDLDFGVLKMKAKCSKTHHNGLKSIKSSIKNAFSYIRIGIGKPDCDVLDYVLNEFNAKEMNKLPIVLEHIDCVVQKIVNNSSVDSVIQYCNTMKVVS